MSTLRVLHVIDSLALGGAQTALLNLLKFSDRTRFTHEVAPLHGEGFFKQAFVELGIPVHFLSAHRFPPSYLWRLPLLLKRGDFDIVHCHLFGSNWIAKPIAAVCGVRCRYNHDQCNDAFRSQSSLVTGIDRWLNRWSTRVFAVSRSIESFLHFQEGLQKDRVTYLPNGVDLEIFKPRERGLDAALESDGVLQDPEFTHQGPYLIQNAPVPEGLNAGCLPVSVKRQEGLVIGGMGRLTAQKNFSLLLEAARPLLNRNASRILMLAGEGPEEMVLRKNAQDLGHQVRFLGSVRDRPAFLQGLDVLILPSRYEGLPLVLLEAMACGIPVVASAVDGIQEILKHEENALLVMPEDRLGLQEAIERMLQDDALRQRLASRALETVRAAFDARQLVQELEKWYEWDLRCIFASYDGG